MFRFLFGTPTNFHVFHWHRTRKILGWFERTQRTWYFCTITIMGSMTGSFPVIEYVPTRLSNEFRDSIQYKDGVLAVQETHDDVIKWKHFPRYWPFVGGIHRSPMNSPHKGQWRGALMFSLICVWIKSWVNNRKTGDLRRYRAHHGVIVMIRRLIAKIIGHILRLNAGIHIVHLLLHRV